MRQVNVDLEDFRIYNRLGNLVFETTNAATGWDGLFKGKIQKPNAYVWVAEGQGKFSGNRIIRSGTVVLVTSEKP